MMEQVPLLWWDPFNPQERRENPAFWSKLVCYIDDNDTQQYHCYDKYFIWISTSPGSTFVLNLAETFSVRLARISVTTLLHLRHWFGQLSKLVLQ